MIKEERHCQWVRCARLGATFCSHAEEHCCRLPGFTHAAHIISSTAHLVIISITSIFFLLDVSPFLRITSMVSEKKEHLS